jgi:hypothetical protein
MIWFVKVESFPSSYLHNIMTSADAIKDLCSRKYFLSSQNETSEATRAF